MTDLCNMMFVKMNPTLVLHPTLTTMKCLICIVLILVTLAHVAVRRRRCISVTFGKGRKTNDVIHILMPPAR